MSDSTLAPEPEGEEPSLRERLLATFGAAKKLLSTRVEIFGEEASQKAVHLARGLGSLALALVVGGIAMLLFTALLVALFTLLFGHLWAGILATLVLYGGVAAAAAVVGAKALAKVRPTEFPVTQAELSKDWEALASQWRSREDGEDAGGLESPEPYPSATTRSRASEGTVDDFEARFRAGSE